MVEVGGPVDLGESPIHEVSPSPTDSVKESDLVNRKEGKGRRDSLSTFVLSKSFERIRFSDDSIGLDLCPSGVKENSPVDRTGSLALNCWNESVRGRLSVE
jgi:hypothetical protein